MPGEKRPRWFPAEGVGSLVRGVGNAAGLKQMGVWVRDIEPGFKGTHRHFHTVEEEWVYVLSGRGSVRVGPLALEVRAGSFVGFPPGPRPHHFIAAASEPLVLLEGGERRPKEDRGWYVDLGVRWHAGEFSETTESPPPEEGDAFQVTHIDAVTSVEFQHEVDHAARRTYRSLHTPTGLTRQAVRWTQVQRGDRSTAYHTHEHTDEWIYILEGRAQVRVGHQRFEVGPGDFIGHPAGAEPHAMEPTEPLTYLMGGQIDPNDVVRYPEAGLRLEQGRVVRG
jgi:uncharacterized cupin superfamily protein